MASKQLKDKETEALMNNPNISENTKKQLQKAAEAKADRNFDALGMAGGGPVGIVTNGAAMIKDGREARKAEKKAKESLKKDMKHLSKAEQVAIKQEYNDAKAKATKDAILSKPKRELEKTGETIKDAGRVITGQTTIKEIKQDKKDAEKVEDAMLEADQNVQVKENKKNKTLKKKLDEKDKVIEDAADKLDIEEAQQELDDAKAMAEAPVQHNPDAIAPTSQDIAAEVVDTERVVSNELSSNNAVPYEKMVQDANRLQANLETQPSGPDYGMGYN